jgi:prevent-host-death family protein
VRTRDIDVADAIRQAVAGQAEAVSAESIGLDNLGTGLKIIMMNAANQLWLRQVQLVIAAVDEDALGVEERSHGSVTEHGRLFQAVKKVLRHCLEDTRRQGIAPTTLSGLAGGCILVAPNKVLSEERTMLDITKDIQSLTTFRRQSGDFMKHLKKRKRPVVLTVNGKAAAVVQDAEAYQRLLHIAARADEEEAIRQGLEDAKAGRTRPAKEVFDEIRRKYDIPR